MTDQIKPYPLISQAIREGSKDDLVSLLERFPEMEDLAVPAFGTWLHYAAAHGTTEIVEYLVNRGFQPDSRDNREGQNPAALAATKGKARILAYLIDRGAQMDTSTSIRNPLFGAIIGRSYDAAEVLLKAGIDTRPSYTFGSTTLPVDAIAFAMLHGQREIAGLIGRSRGLDSESVEALMAEGLRVAQAITTPSDQA